MSKILEVRNLYKQFNMEAGFFSKNRQNVYAVNDLSFSIEKGSTFGIVGESGCGKTTTAKMIIQLYISILGIGIEIVEKVSCCHHFSAS